MKSAISVTQTYVTCKQTVVKSISKKWSKYTGSKWLILRTKTPQCQILNLQANIHISWYLVTY